MNEIKICVGSLNPTKISAVKAAFRKYYKNCAIYRIKADSKVPDQPIGMNLIVSGAINRAKSALNYLINEINANKNIFGVGLEAGLVKVLYSNTGYMDFQFCSIIDENKNITLGSGIAFEYPQKIIDKILSEDKEIGEIMGKIAKNANLKNEAGAISFLSKNVINRTEILTQATICALLPRINEGLYKKC